MKLTLRNRMRYTPLAAALALLLAPALATASHHEGKEAMTSSDHAAKSEAAAASAPLDAMAVAVKDAYREGQIWATYVANPKLDSFDLFVDVSGDKATLTGSVDSMVDRKLAERIALSTDGITGVDNMIAVDPTLVVAVTRTAPTFGDFVADATLASMVDSKLLWNQNTDGLDIDVQARAGAVTLQGVADTPYAKDLAGQLAASTPGTVRVNNLLKVDDSSRGQVATAEAGEGDSALSDTWIVARVNSTLLWTSGVDGTDIDVQADDGVVTLTGSVDSGYEKQLAIEVAQGIRGVRRVDASGLERTSLADSLSQR